MGRGSLRHVRHLLNGGRMASRWEKVARRSLVLFSALKASSTTVTAIATVSGGRSGGWADEMTGRVRCRKSYKLSTFYQNFNKIQFKYHQNFTCGSICHFFGKSKKMLIFELFNTILLHIIQNRIGTKSLEMKKSSGKNATTTKDIYAFSPLN